MSDPKKTPANPWPEGYRQLDDEEARDTILFGAHKDQPNMKVDGVLLSLMEKGICVIAISRDGELALEATQFAVEEDGRERGQA